MTAKTSIKDLKSIIKDSVDGALADKMIDGEKETRAAFDAALKKGDPEFMSKLRAFISGDGSKQASVDRVRDYRVETDPLKGKGLAFGRAVRCIARAKQIGGVTSPQDVARQFAKMGNPGYEQVAPVLEATARAVEAGNLASAGILIPEVIADEVIELLYAQTVASKLGARDMAFNGTVSLGRLNQGASVSYIGEEQNIVPSQPQFGAVKLTGKKAAGLVPFTNDFLKLASPGADAIIRDDLLQAMALRRDLSFYRGTGTEAQPKGIYQWVAPSQRFNQSGTALANVVADYIQMARLVDESNIAGLDTAAYVMAPRTAWALAKMLDGQGNFVFLPMIMAGQLFGFRIGKTTQIPTNLSGSQSEVYFGVHSDVILGRDTARPLEVEMQVNGAYFNGSTVVAGFSNDTTPVRIIESHDVAARHNNSFAVLEQVTLS